MFAFEVCRAVGCDHPDNLKLTAGQLFEWWILWNEEPWGDRREDLRTWAHAGLMFGVKELEPHWPYFPPEWTLDEIRERTRELEEAAERVANGTGSQDQHRD